MIKYRIINNKIKGKILFNRYLKEWIKEKLFKCEFERLNLITQFDNIEFESINYTKEINCFNADNIKDIFCFYNNNTYSIADKFQSILTVKKYKEEIDLKKLDSIYNSKSKSSGIKFKTLFEFGLYNNIDYNISLEGLTNEALRRGFSVNKYNWNNKLEWINDGTSHRVSSLIYHLFCNKQSYLINMEISEYDLDIKRMKDVFLSHDIFLVNDKNKNDICRLLTKSGILDNHIITLEKDRTLFYIFINKNSLTSSNLILKELKKVKDSKVLYLNDFIKNIKH